MVTHAPDGWHTVTPRITVDGASGLVAFLRRTFKATGRFRRDRPSEIRIGDSRIMISGIGPRDPMPAFLYVYVDDVDATYRRALNAGATALEAPQDQPYGDRRAMVKDRWGNLWQIAARQKARRRTQYPASAGPPRCVRLTTSAKAAVVRRSLRRRRKADTTALSESRASAGTPEGPAR